MFSVRQELTFKILFRWTLSYKWSLTETLLPKRLIGAFEAVYESDQSPALRLGTHWKDVILDPNVVTLFFTVSISQMLGLCVCFVGMFESSAAEVSGSHSCSIEVRVVTTQLVCPQIHWKVRENPQLAHHSLNCLVQLASLNGTVFANKDVRVQYHSNYLRNFLNLVTRWVLYMSVVAGIHWDSLHWSTVLLEVLIFTQLLKWPAIYRAF
jgi:hypothetical protein